MNRKQREKNRENAKMLEHHAVICPECGERGKHWIVTRHLSLAMLFAGIPEEGFWTCAKFYGPDGRRIDA